MKTAKIHALSPGPEPPGHLREHGAAFWRDLTRRYGINDAAGLALATMAAAAYDRLQEARAAIDEHGAVAYCLARMLRIGCRQAPCHPERRRAQSVGRRHRGRPGAR